MMKKIQTEKDKLFYFKNFALSHHKSTLKIGTESVLLGAITKVKGVKNILDIGCGCGVISFCLADKFLKENPSQSCSITGIDIDADSIEEAQYNTTIFPTQSFVEFNFQKIALQDFISPILFDLIVSNPPYFSEDLKPFHPTKQISKHQDYSLNFNDLIEGVNHCLSVNGFFTLILPFREYIEFQKLSKNKLYLWKQWFIYPHIGKPANRVIAVYSKTMNHMAICTDHFYIRDENLHFTEAYKNLTKDLHNPPLNSSNFSE